jgi:hypothetical protein
MTYAELQDELAHAIAGYLGAAGILDRAERHRFAVPVLREAGAGGVHVQVAAIARLTLDRIRLDSRAIRHPNETMKGLP